jgi:hypothetical protein
MVEESVKLRFYLTFVIIFVFALVATSFAQADTALAQFTSSSSDSFAGGISGNGRFVVFESRGNLATEDPRNADGNIEIFLWDYAQRRIYQITDTKNLLFNPDGGNNLANIRVEIVNVRPVISNDGKWIAFSSNATIAFPGDGNPQHPQVISDTNPGRFDANAFSSPTPTPTPTVSPSPSPTATPTPAANGLTYDGNLEIWLYQIPTYPEVADLSAGDEIAPVNLSPFNADGTPTSAAFVRVTNTFPSQIPRPGSTFQNPFVANDNHDASISDDGHAIAFVSTRDLIAGHNTFPNNDNDEIFTYVQGVGIKQVTETPRGPVQTPIYSKYPTISGSGNRVAFASTGDNPIIGMTGGSNPISSYNEEIFFSDLDATGAPTGIKRQVTTTTPTNPGDIVNLLDPGRRMSRDGRYIAFDSYADLAGESAGANQTSFALYVYDSTLTTGAFRRIGPRSNADSAASGGDIAHYPGFTDTDVMGTPQTLVLETRLNIKPDGTVASTESDGLNPDPARPVQIYSFPLNAAGASAIFKRLTKLPVSQTFLASTQPFPSNTQQRIAFTLGLTDPGTGNTDLTSEVFYLLQPTATSTTTTPLHFETGASRLAVVSSPTPTPSPTATPTATPTPTASPTATPTPTTPSAVLGLAPGMLAMINFTTPLVPAVTPRTAVGSLERSPTLPIELSGVSFTINGVACGLKSVSSNSIVFVVPPTIPADTTGKNYTVVLNNNGVALKDTLTLVAARPDVFTTGAPGPGGRARMLNITNTVFTREPFTVFTIQRRGARRIPSKMRLYLTGLGTGANTSYSIRIGEATAQGTSILAAPVLVEPGVYYIDFAMPTNLIGDGDRPVVVTVRVSGVDFVSRLDDTAPKVFIIGMIH